jgi:hypothetical protein
MLDDGISIDTHELDGLADLLDKFPLEVQDRMVRQAVGAGAAVLMLGVMEKAPVRTDAGSSKSTALPPGMLKADIHAVAGRAGRIWFIGAGPRTAYVLRWLERGHMLVTGKKKGKHEVGHVPAYPVLRPAFDEYWQRALHATAEELQARIAAYWRKSVGVIKRAA